MKRTPIKPTKSRRTKSYDAEFAVARLDALRKAKNLCSAAEFLPDGLGALVDSNTFDLMFRDCTGYANHVHHRKERSQGGSNDLDNLLPVCLNCHAFIHAHPAFSYEYGLLLHANESESLN